MTMHALGGQPLTGYEPTADTVTAETIAAFHELLASAPTGDDPFTGVDVTDWDDYGTWDDADQAMQESMRAHHSIRRFR